MNEAERQHAQQAKQIRYTELKDPVVCLALGLGSGLSPKAPGTAGTVMTIPLYLLIQDLPLMVYALITLLITLSGIWICSYSARKLGVHDHPAIVIDEVAGFLITMFAAPAGWPWLLAGFVLFRFFDALKPWPISWLDKNVKGGFGIMIDDIAAGLVSMILLQAYWYGFVQA
ncbi:MAG: phosphatidylglycerophosphatase A [Gammaproteobacteria bacterium]|nr:phosphatidylglycerophosphatase A [Gammaproteobacteria bacterium]